MVRSVFRGSLLVALMGLSLVTFGQSNCARVLNEAENDYQRGNLYAIPDKLSECLKGGFQKGEMVQAYRLLALTYLNINQEDNAREALIALLKVNPEYKLGATTPAEFENLFNQINTDPYLYVGIHVNVGLSNVVVMREYSVSSNSNDPQAEYNGMASIATGIQVTVPINKWLGITAQPGFSQVEFGFNEGIKSQFEALAPIQVTNLKERNRYWDLPLMARFNKELDRITLVAYVGGFASTMISTKFIDVERINFFDPITNKVIDNELDMLDRRRKFNLGYQAQLGITFNYLGLNWETRAGIKEQIFNQAKYANVTDRLEDAFKYNYLYIDNDFRSRVFFLSLTVSKPFYNFYRAKK